MVLKNPSEIIFLTTLFYSQSYRIESGGGRHAPLTMLNDAMLQQGPTQLQPLASTGHLSILQQPVNELAARERALICHLFLLPQLEDGVPAADETGQENIGGWRVSRN